MSSDATLLLLSRLGLKDIAHVADVSRAPGVYQWPCVEDAVINSRIFLFSDKTFILSEQLDAAFDIALDKGDWHFADGVLRLVSDNDVTWDPEKPHQFLVVELIDDKSLCLVQLDIPTRPQSGESARAFLEAEVWWQVNDDSGHDPQAVLRNLWRPEWCRLHLNRRHSR